MKSRKLMIVALALTAGLLIAATGAVAASDLFHGRGPIIPGAENSDQDEYGWGPMHGMGWFDEDEDWRAELQSERIAALAEATDLSVEEIQTRLAEGDRLFSIASDEGVTPTEFFELMSDVRESFLEKARDEGWISGDLYDWMLERMEQVQGFIGGRGRPRQRGPLPGMHWFDEDSEWRTQLHNEMILAVADAAGLTIDDIETRIEDGERLVDIADDAGLSGEAFFQLMTDVRKSVLDRALEDGVISEAQYDRLLQRMDEGQRPYRGEFPCHPYGGEPAYPFGGRGRGRMGGW